jgi:hypothetical protein
MKCFFCEGSLIERTLFDLDGNEVDMVSQCGRCYSLFKNNSEKINIKKIKVRIIRWDFDRIDGITKLVLYYDSETFDGRVVTELVNIDNILEFFGTETLAGVEGEFCEIKTKKVNDTIEIYGDKIYRNNTEIKI